jgi:hypothetical protein
MQVICDKDGRKRLDYSVPIISNLPSYSANMAMRAAAVWSNLLSMLRLRAAIIGDPGARSCKRYEERNKCGQLAVVVDDARCATLVEKKLRRPRVRLLKSPSNDSAGRRQYGPFSRSCGMREEGKSFGSE